MRQPGILDKVKGCWLRGTARSVAVLDSRIGNKSGMLPILLWLPRLLPFTAGLFVSRSPIWMPPQRVPSRRVGECLRTHPTAHDASYSRIVSRGPLPWGTPRFARRRPDLGVHFTLSDDGRSPAGSARPDHRCVRQALPPIPRVLPSGHATMPSRPRSLRDLSTHLRSRKSSRKFPAIPRGVF